MSGGASAALRDARDQRCDAPAADTAPPPADTAALAASIRRHRRSGWTVERMGAFLRRLEEAGEVREACGAIGLSARSAYKLRARNAAFARGWAAALARHEARERRALAAAFQLAADEAETTAPSGLSDERLRRALAHADDVLARRSRQAGGNFGRRDGEMGAFGVNEVGT
ncbi:MAG: hypothetical protein ABR601_06400 [Parasphingopyxis sp.]|nr:hypothetical protein [Sphingomonadales bacterium]